MNENIAFPHFDSKYYEIKDPFGHKLDKGKVKKIKPFISASKGSFKVKKRSMGEEFKKDMRNEFGSSYVQRFIKFWVGLELYARLLLIISLAIFSITYYLIKKL